MTILKKLFRFEKSDDWQVEDDQYVLIESPNITIQCCDVGGFSVNQWNEKDETQTFHKLHDDLELAFYHAASLK